MFVFICVVAHISWSTVHLQITRRDNTLYRINLCFKETFAHLIIYICNETFICLTNIHRICKTVLFSNNFNNIKKDIYIYFFLYDCMLVCIKGDLYFAIYYFHLSINLQFILL